MSLNSLKKPTRNYTVIPNEIFNLTDISSDARFAYCYLLSKPQGWVVRVKHTCDQLKCGRGKTLRMLNELKDNGLLSYKAKKEGGGVYTLHEITDVRKADSGKADSGLSNHIVSTDKTANTYKDYLSDSGESDVLCVKEYLQARNDYKPRSPNDNQAKAWKAWKTRIREGVPVADLVNGMRRYNKACKADETHVRHILHMSTFLNPDRSWEQEWKPQPAEQRVPVGDAEIMKLARDRNLKLPPNCNTYEARLAIAEQTGMKL
jgi:hypothetical protein